MGARHEPTTNTVNKKRSFDYVSKIVYELQKTRSRLLHVQDKPNSLELQPGAKPGGGGSSGVPHHYIQPITSPNSLDTTSMIPFDDVIYVTIGASGNSFLDTILGNGNVQTMLIVEGTKGYSFTIRDTSATLSNIRTPDGQNLLVVDDDIFVFIFDDLDGSNGQTGLWKMMTSGKAFYLGVDADANNFFIHNVKSPLVCGDAVNKCYVDAAIAALGGVSGVNPPALIIERISETVLVFTDKNRQYTNFIAPDAISVSQKTTVNDDFTVTQGGTDIFGNPGFTVMDAIDFTGASLFPKSWWGQSLDFQIWDAGNQNEQGDLGHHSLDANGHINFFFSVFLVSFPHGLYTMRANFNGQTAIVNFAFAA